MTYRFKFTQEFDSALAEFSEPFKYNNDRKEFKDAFQRWASQHEESVSKETARLKDLKYEGDILNKMFVSARYYYRKRTSTTSNPRKRRCYKAVGSSLIQAIDNRDRNNEVVKVINLLGQEVEINSTGVLIYIYSDGTIKRIVNN